MDYQELYRFVSDAKQDVVCGVREDQVVAYGTPAEGVVVTLVGTRKQRHGFPNDFIVEAPGWETVRPSWPEIVGIAADLGDCARLSRLIEGLGYGSAPEDIVAELALEPRLRRRWLRFAEVVQPMMLQEDFNYPGANGRWTPVHLLLCVARGADAALVADAADAMTAGRALREADCGQCDACDRRMWHTTWPNSLKLRRFYE